MNIARRTALIGLVLAAGAIFAPPVLAQERAFVWKDVERIVAVGDVHGDYGQLVRCLRDARVMDEDRRWIGGKTHLVQTGDIFGRGTESRKALDLLMALEPQAEKAGGRVHVLLGNHEAMVLAGYYGYLRPEDVEAFGGAAELQKAMRAEGNYGRWLRGRPAAIQINDILFVHGGLSADYAGLSLQEINDRVRRALGGEGGAADDPAGPLWYRGLAIEDEETVRGVLDTVWRAHGARRIVIGHTVAPAQEIRVRAGGVILIDVGMSRGYLNGPAAFLRIEGGRFVAVADGRERELEIAPDRPASAPAAPALEPAVTPPR